MPPDTRESESGTEAADRAGEPDYVSKDLAERIFGVQATEGQTEDFVEHKDDLGAIYDVIHELVQLAYDKGTLEFPTATDIYRAMTENRRRAANRKPMPDQDSFRDLLLILVGQPSPFIHLTRELVFEAKQGGGPEIKVRTRYVVPSSPKENTVMRGYKTALMKSSLGLKNAMQQKLVFTNWADVQETFKETKSLDSVAAAIRQERADLLARSIFLRPPSGGDERRIEHVHAANRQLRRWLYLPLIKELQAGGALRVISCQDIRNSSTAALRSFPDLVYFNDGDRLRARYLNLCLFLISDAFKKVNDLDLFQNAYYTRKEVDKFLEECEPLAKDLLKKLQSGKEMPAPMPEFIIEAVKLSEMVRAAREAAQQKKEHEALKTIVDGIKNTANLVEIYKRGGKQRFKEQYIREIMAGRKVSGLLIGSVPSMDVVEPGRNTPLTEFDVVYALPRNEVAVQNAIDSAVDLFEKSGDKYLLELLEDILGLDRTPEDKLREFIGPKPLFELKETLRKAYSQHLTWWRRMLMFLTGSEVGVDEVAAIKQHRREKQAEALRRRRDAGMEDRRRDAKQEIKARAQENIKGGVDEKKTMANMVSFLEESWGRFAFPGRGVLEKSENLGSSFYIGKILDGADGGGAGYADIVRIPVSDGAVYGSRNYIQQHGARLKKELNAKIDELIPVLTSSKINETQKSAARRNHVLYGAVLKYLEEKS